MLGRWIIVLCAVGLVLLIAYLIFRISSHRKKVRELDRMSREIGAQGSSGRKGSIDEREPIRDPVVPKNDLLVLFHRNGNEAWLRSFIERSKGGINGLIVTPVPPGPGRRVYPASAKVIWLDRSVSHPKEEGITVVNPTNLSALLREIEDHFSRGRVEGMLLLDDFESVLAANEPVRAIRFLSMLRTSCSRKGFSALVPVAYRAVPQRVRNQLSESLETVVIG